MNVTTRQALVEKVKDDGVLSSSSYGTVEVKMFVRFGITLYHILYRRCLSHAYTACSLTSQVVINMGAPY